MTAAGHRPDAGADVMMLAGSRPATRDAMRSSTSLISSVNASASRALDRDVLGQVGEGKLLGRDAPATSYQTRRSWFSESEST